MYTIIQIFKDNQASYNNNKHSLSDFEMISEKKKKKMKKEKK